MSMILHCGANPVSRHDPLMTMEPEALGPRHHPIPHISFIDGVTSALNHFGLTIQDEQFGVLADGSRMFGLMQIESKFNTDFATMVGIRASHDNSIAAGLAAGARVFVCDNLSFSGNATFKTKQTTYLEKRLPGLIYEAVETLPGFFEVQEQRFGAYKGRELKPRWGDAALVELMRRGVINPSQMGKAINEWDTPSHEEHLDPVLGRTVWTLHNAVTEAIKAPVNDQGEPSRPMVLSNMARTVPMTQFLDEIVGFDMAA